VLTHGMRNGLHRWFPVGLIIRGPRDVGTGEIATCSDNPMHRNRPLPDDPPRGGSIHPKPRETDMTRTTPEQNKALVLEAFETLFNKRDYAADDPNFRDLPRHLRRDVRPRRSSSYISATSTQGLPNVDPVYTWV
jgi:hypothetical protein